MGLALDTSVLVELERQGAALIEAVPADTEAVFLPAPVIAELWIGIELADSLQRRAARQRKIDALLDACTVLPFDERVAPTYATLYAALRKAGTPIPANDLSIAALTLHFGHTLLVGPRDEADFRKVPGLAMRVLFSEGS